MGHSGAPAHFWSMLDRPIRQLALAAMAALAAAWAPSPSHAQAEGACVPWSQARGVVAQNQLRSVRGVRKVIENRYGGQVIHANLCRSGGRFVYRLVIMEPGGNVRNVEVNAGK